MVRTKHIIAGLCILPLGVFGCAGTAATTEPAQAELMAVQITGEGETEQFDLNGDGRPDVWKIYTAKKVGEKRSRLLGRAELDVNFDGQVDMRQFFAESGAMVRETMDMDFDGRVDAIDHYKDGRLARREILMNFSETPSIWKYYEEDKLVRKETDTQGNGKPDTFEFFEDGKIAKVGWDRNGDGKPDQYELPGQKKKKAMR